MVTAYVLIFLGVAAFLGAVRSTVRRRAEAPGVEVGESYGAGSFFRFLDGVLAAPALEEERRRDSDQIERLRARVARDYAQRLGQSLHGHSVRVELGLDSDPGAVTQGLDRYLLRDRSTKTLPQGTTVREVFRDAGDLDDGRVLILGDPGAGKTIMLLELAVALLS